MGYATLNQPNELTPSHFQTHLEEVGKLLLRIRDSHFHTPICNE